MGEDFNRLLYISFNIAAFTVAFMGTALFIYACYTVLK